MAIDSNSAAQLILKGYSELNASTKAAAGPAAAAAAAPDFCALWPKAKPILQVLDHCDRADPGRRHRWRRHS